MNLIDIDKIAYGWDSPSYITKTKDFLRLQSEEIGDQSVYNKLLDDLLTNLYHPEQIKHQMNMCYSSIDYKVKVPEVFFLNTMIVILQVLSIAQVLKKVMFFQ